MSEHDANDRDRYSIDELSALAGVTPRTVRDYIAEGLLERPAGEKRGAHHLRRHLEQRLLVRRWTDAGQSLDRVRELSTGAPEDPPRGAAGLGGGLAPRHGGRRPRRPASAPNSCVPSCAASLRCTASCAPRKPCPGRETMNAMPSC